MKKIYAFTLDDDVPSEELFSDLRLIAYLIHEKIIELYGVETKKGLFVNDKNIIYNELLEDKSMYIDNKMYYYYKLKSDLDNIKRRIFYDPFIIDFNTFGITIDEHDHIDIDKIFEDIYKDNLCNTILRKKYKYKIFSCLYDDDDNRKQAISNIIDSKKISANNNKKESLIKRLSRRFNIIN